ncbi:hypothetical protein K438DRAFT_1884963, partial [Mycena galopus ATCC 62051]
MNDSDIEKPKRQPVRANPEQLKILKASIALIPGRGFTAEECIKLSTETGLTRTWIKSWVTRFRKSEKGSDERPKKRAAVKSEPEDAPPLKRGRRRSARQPKLESPPPEWQIAPDTDDSRIPSSSRNPTPANPPPATYPSASGQNISPVSHAVPGSSVYFAGTPIFSKFQLPPPLQPSASRPQQSPSQQHPQQSLYQHSHPAGAMLLPRQSTETPNQQHKSSASRPQLSPNSAYQRSHMQSSYQYSHPAPAMVLLRQSSENVNPAQRPVNAWGIPYNHAAPLLVPSVRDTYAHSSPSSFVPNPVALPSLFVGNHLPPPHASATVNRTAEISPFTSNTPIHNLRSPFNSSFSNEPIKHTHPLITPSHLASYIPKHNFENENDDSQSTVATEFNIDDNLLFSSVTPCILAFPFRSLTLLVRCSISLPRAL